MLDVIRDRLMFMDNPESHLLIAVIHFCRDNGIHILTRTPHISNGLQPLYVLDRLKIYYYKSTQNWLLNYPNTILFVFEVSQLNYKV